MILKQKRSRIDTIDSRIVKLLADRFKIAKDIRKSKKKKGLRMTDRKREKEVIDHAKNMTRHTDLDEQFVEKLFKDIIKYTKNKQK